MTKEFYPSSCNQNIVSLGTGAEKNPEKVWSLSKKLKFNFGTEKISLDEQYILGSDSGQLETRTVNALFVEMQHMEQYCCEISEGQ